MAELRQAANLEALAIGDAWSLLEDAADEIERLRDELHQSRLIFREATRRTRHA